MRAYIKYILPVAIVCVAFAGDDVKKQAVEWFKQVNDAYKSIPAISFETQYTVYRGHDEQTPYETKTAYVKRKGTIMYSQLIDGVETIQNKEIMLMKDDSSKVILLKQPVSVKQLEASLNLDFAVNAASSVSPIKINQKTSGYSMRFDSKKRMDFSRIDMLFDNEKKVFSEITVWYNTKINFTKNPGVKDDFVSPRMKITFSNVKTNAQLSDDVFSTTKYITKTKKGWALQPACKKYQLIDQTNLYKD